MNIAIVFPHQLFKNTPLLDKCKKVYLIEDHLYFKQFKFHKQKLILHRASMKFYEDYLQKAGKEVSYIECKGHDGLEEIISKIKKEGCENLYVIEPSDYLIEKALKNKSDKQGIDLEVIPNPGFLTPIESFDELLDDKYFMNSFYIKQRKRMGLLLDDKSKPIGGKWSFDADNRKKIPKGEEIPAYTVPEDNKFVKEAKKYVSKNFPDAFGNDDVFYYPVTFDSAKSNFVQFLKTKFSRFGDYEDAIKQDEKFLFHSVLTPSLNIGLITPSEILDILFEHHEKEDFPINSLEGFVRQIIGWREFMRIIYLREGSNIRNQNFFNNSREIPESLWNGTTGIPPIDDSIAKVTETGYLHHIERLMVLGNFMLLTGIEPLEIYKWFMTFFIDAYDWVMVPNVYSMSQYADGGLITTKPYISGSNYILKMSDYKKDMWCESWNALYWNFIGEHYDLLKGNRRMSMMLSVYDKFGKEKKKSYKETSLDVIDKLFN